MGAIRADALGRRRPFWAGGMEVLPDPGLAPGVGARLIS